MFLIFFFFIQPSRENYRKVFIIAASIAAFGGTFFIIFCSGEQQSWNDPENYSPTSLKQGKKLGDDSDDAIIENGGKEMEPFSNISLDSTKL